MEPELVHLASALDRKRRKGESSKDYLAALTELLTFLVSLDLGMVNGVVVPKARRDLLMTEGCSLADTWFAKAATLDTARARRWLAMPMYARPKTIDFGAWQLATEKGASLPVTPIDPADPSVPRELGRAMLALSELTRDASHVMHPAASEAQLDDREHEIGVAIPVELRMLYRLCNGFALFCRAGTVDLEGSPFRFVPLHELQTFAWTAGDELPRRTKRERPLVELVDDPAQLQAFCVGNGDFVSCASDPERTIWIDDYSDGPQHALTSSLSVLLNYVLHPDRVCSGAWSADAWQGLRLAA